MTEDRLATALNRLWSAAMDARTAQRAYFSGRMETYKPTDSLRLAQALERRLDELLAELASASLVNTGTIPSPRPDQTGPGNEL